MALDPQEFARLLGAEIVGAVPDVGGGPFGMARLARILHQRLTPSQGGRPGRPTNPDWVTRCKVPMSAATQETLVQLAREMSTPERQVSPMQVAAHLLEEALARVQGQAVANGAEGDPKRDKGTQGLVPEFAPGSEKKRRKKA
jgi:hypothetical protein